MCSLLHWNPDRNVYIKLIGTMLSVSILGVHALEYLSPYCKSDENSELSLLFRNYINLRRIED